MKSTNYFAAVAVLVMISAGALSLRSTPGGGATTSARANPASAQSSEDRKLRVAEAYGKLPLSFEANQGQTDSQVKFLSRGRGYTLFLTGEEAVLALRKPNFESPNWKLARSIQGPPDVVRLRLVGANRAARVEGLDELPGKSYYFIGNDPEQWRSKVPNYARVRYQAVYPGVDLVYYGNQGELEYDFVVAPGADPKPIQLSFRGARRIRIDPESGDLKLEGTGGELRFHRPVVYQIDDGKHWVEARYVLKPGKQVGIEVGSYDAAKPLVIDPVLAYSTYLGGSGIDAGRGIAVDSSGNAYVTGSTFSSNFPTVNPLPAPNNALQGVSDAFVSKLSFNPVPIQFGG